MFRAPSYPWSDKLASSQVAKITLAWKITGAKTVTELLGAPVIHTFDAGLDTLAEITAALPNITTDEFVAATAFGSTAMGTDAFGFVLDMEGQAQEVKFVEAKVYGGAAANITSMNGVAGADPMLGVAFAGQKTALTDALTDQATVSSNGNIGAHFAITGLDALTAGVLVVDLYVKVK